MNPHPLFDTDWYLQQYPDVAAAGINPLQHYMTHGWREGRDPSPLFDTSFYLERNPDIAAAEINPLVHFIQFGRKEGREPHPNSINATIERHVISDEIENRIVLSSQNIDAVPLVGSGTKNVGLDALNVLFDAHWYLTQNPDLAAPGIDLYQHYLWYGANEGRDPNPWFDSDWYLQQYSDVAATGINPLIHYIEHGAQECRNPSPWFNTYRYFLDHPGIAENGINPLAHFLTTGGAHSPDPFSLKLLQKRLGNRLVQNTGLTDLIDFPAQQLSPSKPFDISCLDIHWIIPDFTAGGGGHMTIFRVVRFLELFGHRCTIWIPRPTLNQSESAAYEVAVKNYQQVNAPIKFISSELLDAQGDIVVSTSWDTVAFAMHASNFSERFYFVQDYEPAFFAAGSHSLAAELTYSNDISCFCASPWLAEKLSKNFGRWTRYSWLAVDFDTYSPVSKSNNNGPKPVIAFYSRTHTERRCVELGFLALEELSKLGVDFHVNFFGSGHEIPHQNYSFTNFGVVSEKDLAKIYQSSDVGIVFSATNYSLVPQEMMAAGLPVVELNTESTRRIYPDNAAALAGPHPSDIAQRIFDLINDRERRDQQSKAALEWVRQFSWGSFARDFERALIERLMERNPVNQMASPALHKERPKASVIIPTLNGGDLFKKVVGAVQSQQAPWDFELIVVDSESTDGTAEFASSLPNVRFHSIRKKEFQHGKTRNLGIELSAGDFVAFLTQDALPADQYWLYNIVSLFSNFPRAAAAFGRHLPYPSASPFLKYDMERFFDGFNQYPVAISKYTNIASWNANDISWRQTLHFYSDNNSCLRRTAWENVPYPFVDYGEDQVWAMRIIDAGYEKLYAKHAVVYHSHDYDYDGMYQKCFEDSRFFKKHFDYDCAPADKMVENTISEINAADEAWARENEIDKKWVPIQRTLNEAKIRGFLAGMNSTSYVGY